ncbi:Glutamine synthetase, beta-Grasp domain protein [mine drainage metagenome]|uniref:Glutamine synthetase, beta-Grasp domain protein n=1 Tax=mine drainage metagenome TaxID=410659 RepID=T0ZKR3_9ZZZZ
MSDERRWADPLAEAPAPTPEAILERLREEKVRWIELFFTDLIGGFNRVQVPLATIDSDSFVSGVPKLDGSSVRGFREIYESDMLLRPDPSTLASIPWDEGQGPTARFICDILYGGTADVYPHRSEGDRPPGLPGPRRRRLRPQLLGAGDRVLPLRRGPPSPLARGGPGRLGRIGLSDRELGGAVDRRGPAPPWPGSRRATTGPPPTIR